ncbi:MAG TPA: PAS domain S-box protein [Burkholderiales bacterium]
MAGKAKRSSRRGLARPRRGRPASAARRGGRLHESLEQFRLAQEALGIVTWIWDAETDRVQWYGDASHLLGMPPRSFSGRFADYLERVHPEDAASARQTFVDCLKGRLTEYRTVDRVLWPDGSVHWLETYGRASRGANHGVRMNGVIKDITEYKKAESARVKAEAQLARVFDASPDYIAVARLKDGGIVAVNAAFERVTGYKASDILGRSVAELNYWVVPGERERFVADLKAQGALGDRPALFRAKDGRVLSALLSASLLEHDGEQLVISIVRDVTDAERLEHRARQSERKYAALFETSPVGLVVTRPRERRIIEINDAALRMIGLRRDEAIGALTTEVAHPDDPDEVDKLRALALSGEPVIARPLRFRRRDGKHIECILSAGTIELDGEPHLVISALDVTGEKQLERRARQSERKYEALFETSPEAIAISRRQDGITLAVNAAWESLIGHRRERAIFRPSGELALWRDPAEREAVIARVDADGIVRNYATRLVRADGRQIDVLLSATSLELEGERCVVWSWRDLSEARQLEQRAFESERKFAALFESSPEPISLMRLSDEVRLAANSAWERVTGHSRDRASSRPATAMSMFRDPLARRRLIDRVAAEGRVSNVELKLVRADGAEFDARISGECIEVDGERCILWNWSDVTEQRRAERERQRADGRYRALFETALDGFVIGTADNTVLDANPAACAMTGYAREELSGVHVSKLFRAEDLAVKPLRRDLGKRWSAVERVLARKDGGSLHVEVVAGPMPDGNVLAMMRDITERKRSETLVMNIARGVSAEVGEAFFHSLVEHLARELEADFAFIGELLPEGRMHTLAFLADGARGLNPDYPVEGSMSAQALAERRTVVFAQDVARRFPDNAEMQKHAIQAYVGTPLYGADGAPLGVLAVAHRKPVERSGFWASMIEIFGARAAAEIERARAEALVRRTNESLEEVVRERTAQLEEANRDLESYNYSISHDLRQPLNAIAGFAELLRGQAGAGPQAEFVEEIESNAARMEQMIEALLRLARAGRGAIRRTRLDTRALVESVLRDLSAAAPVAEVSLGELPEASGDEVLLRQVWANLIGNALKYSRQTAAPRVEIEGRRDGDSVEFTVRDNGVGFDMQHATRLFDPFQRLPSARAFDGSGVGLAIVERILRRHGGSIRAQSTPGNGAVFRFTLPG